jgi:hypothetical protein
MTRLISFHRCRLPANADGNFTVADRSDFKNSWDAANFACDHQFQLCQRAANQQGSTFSVNECDAQSNKCKRFV